MPAHAGTFSISPIRLDLSKALQSAAITVRNDDREVLVQAEVVLWEQVDGEDRLTPTRRPGRVTGRIHPATERLATGARRTAGPPADVTRELSYRLILQEVPQAASPGLLGAQVSLRLSVPIFVANEGTRGPELAWSATASGNGCSSPPATRATCIRAFMDSRLHPSRASARRLCSLRPRTSSRAVSQLASRAGTGGNDICRHWGRLRLKVTTDDGESETELDHYRRVSDAHRAALRPVADTRGPMGAGARRCTAGRCARRGRDRRAAAQRPGNRSGVARAP